MKKEYSGPKYRTMLETGVLEALAARNVNRVELVSSGSNIQEMNDAASMPGLVVDRTMVLMRKIF